MKRRNFNSELLKQMDRSSRHILEGIGLKCVYDHINAPYSTHSLKFICVPVCANIFLERWIQTNRKLWNAISKYYIRVYIWVYTSIVYETYMKWNVNQLFSPFAHAFAVPHGLHKHKHTAHFYGVLTYITSAPNYYYYVYYCDSYLWTWFEWVI